MKISRQVLAVLVCSILKRSQGVFSEAGLCGAIFTKNSTSGIKEIWGSS